MHHPTLYEASKKAERAPHVKQVVSELSHGTGKDLTKERLLLYREPITKKRPALPQQAGRAYVKFQAGATSWALHLVRSRNQAKVLAGSSRKRGQHNITVRAVVKPEPDLKQLAKALIALAKQDLADKLAAEQAIEHGDDGLRPPSAA